MLITPSELGDQRPAPQNQRVQNEQKLGGNHHQLGARHVLAKGNTLHLLSPRDVAQKHETRSLGVTRQGSKGNELRTSRIETRMIPLDQVTNNYSHLSKDEKYQTASRVNGSLTRTESSSRGFSQAHSCSIAGADGAGTAESCSRTFPTLDMEEPRHRQRETK